MIWHFIKTREFICATLILVIAYVSGHFGDLSNIVQNSEVYVFAYVLWREEKNHRLMKDVFGDL